MATVRRYIYEYSRWNPQLGTSTRTGEVYETTLKKAIKTATRHCDDYTTYGSLTFQRIIKVSEPIVVGVDVAERTREYGEWPRTKYVKEYVDKYPQQHTAGWDQLKDI